MVAEASLSLAVEAEVHNGLLTGLHPHVHHGHVDAAALPGAARVDESHEHRVESVQAGDGVADAVARLHGGALRIAVGGGKAAAGLRDGIVAGQLPQRAGGSKAAEGDEYQPGVEFL